jgi:hypothetical protein
MDQLIASPQAAISQTCSTLRAQGHDAIDNMASNIKSIMENALKNVKMNGLSFVGVLAENQTGCYFGEVQNLTTEFGTAKTQLILIGVTVVKNKYVFVDRFSVYTTSDAVADELAKLQSTVVSLQAANK